MTTTTTRRICGSLTRRVLIGSIVTLIVVPVGWWAADRLPGWRDARRLRAAATALRGTDAHTRGEAIRTLGFAQPRSLPLLVEAATDPDPEVRLAALQAIGSPSAIEPEVIPTLVAGLDDPDPSVRSMALLLVARAGPAATTATGRLVELTRDDDRYFRREAARALRRVDPAAESAYRPVLMALLTDPNPTHDPDRTAYAAEVADLGPAARGEAIAALLAILKDSPDPRSRRQAIQGLGRIGAPAFAAVPALNEALVNDADLAGRCFAVDALLAIEGRDGGRTRATLEDLSDRELLPPDLVLHVEKLLELNLTDPADLALARETLDQVACEYQRLEFEAQQAKPSAASPAP